MTETVFDGSAADGVAAGPARRDWTNLVLAVVMVVLLVGIFVAAYFVLQAAKPGQQPQTMEQAQIQQLQQQIAKSPKDASLYLSLAASYYKVKDYDKAVQALSDLQSSVHPTGTVLAEVVYGQAKIEESRGNAGAAISGYERSLSVADTADTRWALGQLYLGRKQYGDAVKNLERYTALMPMDADGYKKLASAYEGAGDRTKALAAYEKAKAYVPNDAGVLAAIKRLKG